MRASPRSRLLAIPLVWLPALVGLVDLHLHARLGAPWRQLQLGHTLTWPPRAKHGPKPAPIDDRAARARSASHVAELAADRCAAASR